MYGVATRNEDEIEWSEFDRAFYEVKSVTGRHTDPSPDATNMVACFGDTATAEAKPDLVPVSADGDRATRDRPYFDWGYVCPLATDYRDGLAEVIRTCVDANDDVRLDDVGFPRAEYCHCQRCEMAFADSEYDDRQAWRTAAITGFLADVRDLVPGRLSVTVHPDPYPGHLATRSGVDLDAITEFVDEIVVPLYDTSYETTYWLESLAAGFADRLSVPLAVELYAVTVDLDDLVHAAEVAATYADSVVFGYDASNARAAIRRLNADDAAGSTYRPADS
ncbi:MAG: hypothetical protein ABEJ57_09190 [Halobacteriaceae archaeon]